MVDSTNLPEVDINAIATDLNNEMDKDGVNAECPVVISRTANSNGGVTEIWSDGYCVQTGITSIASSNDTQTISLTVSYKDTNYFVFYTRKNSGAGNQNDAYVQDFAIYQYNTNSFVLPRGYNGPVRWRTEGYIR